MDGVGIKPVEHAAVPAEAAVVREDDHVVEATCRVAKRKRKGSSRASSLMDLIQAKLERQRKAPVTAEEKAQLNKKINLAIEVMKGSEGDKEQAVMDVKKGFELTNGSSENTMGQFYLQGIGVEKDLDYAFDCFLEGMVQGSMFATLFAGYMLSLQGFARRDYQTAVHCCHLLRQQDRSDALVKMAKAFYELKGESRNLQIVYFICNELLGTEFESTAYYYLGMIQMEGIDICREKPTEGFMKIHRAALLGNDAAKEYVKKTTDVAMGVDSSVPNRKQAFQKLVRVNSDHCEIQSVYEYGLHVLTKYPEPIDHIFLIGKRVIQIFPEGKKLIEKAAALGSDAASRCLLSIRFQDENDALGAPLAESASAVYRERAFDVL